MYFRVAEPVPLKLLSGVPSYCFSSPCVEILLLFVVVFASRKGVTVGGICMCEAQA